MPNTFWLESRLAYDHLSTITEEMNDVISLMMLLSLADNLIYISLNCLYFDDQVFYKYA